MSWADGAIERLRKGEAVRIRPSGNSMTPLIKSGELITVRPCDPTLIKPGDVVLVRVHGKVYLHLVKQKSGRDGLFLISNNQGRVNGWVDGTHIYGKADR